MNDAATALERRIHEGIPLSRAMHYRITLLHDTRIRVEAPLAPNVNVHGTGFAGSLYALGILTAWALCAHLIDRAMIDADLVVAAADIRYRAPIRDDIRCDCTVSAHEAEDFVRQLRQDGRARLAVTVRVGEGPAAQIEAQMHARRSATA